MVLNRRPPATGSGCALASGFEAPTPSCSNSLLPQQYAVLSAAMAQVVEEPALMSVKTSPPGTACGVVAHGDRRPTPHFSGAARPISPEKSDPQQ